MGHIFKFIGNKENIRELWENSESMQKYINHLKELWHNDPFFSKDFKSTLGDLIKEKISIGAITEEEIALWTDISVETIRELIEDKLYPNVIPVKLMIRLFKTLGITVLAGEAAMNNTFKKLQEKKNK